MDGYVYVYMCACIGHVCMNVWMNVVDLCMDYVYMYLCIYRWMDEYVDTYRYRCMNVWICGFLYECVCMRCSPRELR